MKKKKAKNKELVDINNIVNQALRRILSMKTKLTYQQELHLISKTIQDYIEIGYISKELHIKELLEQKFDTINYLEDMKKNIVYTNEIEEARREGFQLAINILKGVGNE